MSAAKTICASIAIAAVTIAGFSSTTASAAAVGQEKQEEFIVRDASPTDSLASPSVAISSPSRTLLEQTRKKKRLLRNSRRRLVEMPFPKSDLIAPSSSSTTRHGNKEQKQQREERFVFEVLVDGLETRDGDNVVVHRYLGGKEKIDLEERRLRRQQQQNAGASSSSTLSQEAYYVTPLGEFSESFPSDTTQIRAMMDPFLVFDAYRSVQRRKDDSGGGKEGGKRKEAGGEPSISSSSHRSEYSGGFPAHPHRGMLEIRHFTVGGLHHTDSCGNNQVTPPGGGQALFAGRGIIHEEKAVSARQLEWLKRRDDDGQHREKLSGQQLLETDSSALFGSGSDDGDEGVDDDDGFKGFQLWLNVPRSHKHLPPSYRSVAAFPTIEITRAYPYKNKRKGTWAQSNSWVMYSFEGDDDEAMEKENKPNMVEERCVRNNHPSGSQCDGALALSVGEDGGDEDLNLFQTPEERLQFPPSFPSTIRVIAGQYDGVVGPFTDMIRGGGDSTHNAKTKLGSAVSTSPNQHRRHELIAAAVAASPTALATATLSSSSDHSSTATSINSNSKEEETVKGFLYLDVTLRCDHPSLSLDLPKGQNTLMYMYNYNGKVLNSHSTMKDSEEEGGEDPTTISEVGMIVGRIKSRNAAFVPINALAILGDGDHVVVSCPASLPIESEISFVLVTAPPVKEKVFIANGFAMGSQKELDDAMQAFDDGTSSWC